VTDPVCFRILGPLRAGVQDRMVELEDGRARLVLAALLLEALETDAPVAVGTLVQAVWDGEPPTSAATQVAFAVSSLRRAFRKAGCGHTVIETVPPGYRLVCGTIDALDAERDIAQARAAAAAGRYEEAAHHYGEALSLWDGQVFEGLQSSPIVAGALRWERLQLAVTEEAAEVTLALGRYNALISELTAWVGEYPFHERLRVLLMTALARAGRHREALQVYSDGCRALREGLDLEPGHELQDLYEAILLDGTWRHPQAPPVPSRVKAPKAPPAKGSPPRTSPPKAPSSKAAPGGRYCAGAVPRTNRWRDSRSPKRPQGPSGEHRRGR
jgi:DNA-binding SARP family transcriptional activator